MPVETFTETTCSKCKKVHRTVGTVENDGTARGLSFPTTWADGALMLYGVDGHLKQQVDLDLCPKCTREILTFLGVPRKRQRKAKAKVTVDPRIGTTGDMAIQATPAVAPQSSGVSPNAEVVTTGDFAISLASRRIVTTTGTPPTGKVVVIPEKSPGLIEPKLLKFKRGRPRKDTVPDAVVDIPCPYRDSTPHIHVQEGDLILCKHPKQEATGGTEQ